ncbi:MAG: protoporphyrinogen oxidase [Planctomycetota bacterium]|jgi:oxygen-dependent protoporphyrinogen oxidase
MRIPERDVIVVGGGISGLVTAWQLEQAGIDVGLLEREDAVGGCMRTERRDDGLILEKGPFNVLVRDESFRDLLVECRDECPPITASKAADARYLLRHGAVTQVPTGPGPLLGTPLLGFGAKIRMLTGMLLSRRADRDDPTIGEVAERRLGREVADTFISAIIAGVFGGDSRKLSLKACFPKAWRFDQERRSPLLYELGVLRQKKKAARAAGDKPTFKGLISFEGGLQALPEWIGRRLGDRLVTGTTVESIERTPGGYELTCRGPGGPTTVACRRLVLATEGAVAARLLRPLAPEASDLLEPIEGGTLVVVNLCYRREDVAHPLAGYGFLVPANEPDVPVMGVLWADSAFPHLAPDDRRILRVFLGGPRDPDVLERSDEQLTDVACRTVKPLLEIRGEPVHTDVSRWPSAIPQYHRGHAERVQRVQEIVDGLDGLHLVGNYLTGVSINDCVRDGTALARAIIDETGPAAAPRGAAAPERVMETIP